MPDVHPYKDMELLNAALKQAQSSANQTGDKYFVGYNDWDNWEAVKLDGWNYAYYSDVTFIEPQIEPGLLQQDGLYGQDLGEDNLLKAQAEQEIKDWENGND